jgi:hypothetical protein
MSEQKSPRLSVAPRLAGTTSGGNPGPERDPRKGTPQPDPKPGPIVHPAPRKG